MKSIKGGLFQSPNEKIDELKNVTCQVQNRLRTVDNEIRDNLTTNLKKMDEIDNKLKKIHKLLKTIAIFLFFYVVLIVLGVIGAFYKYKLYEIIKQ